MGFPMILCRKAENRNTEKRINACGDRLGRDFVMKFRENACSAYGDIEDHAFCFVGISDLPEKSGMERTLFWMMARFSISISGQLQYIV